MLACRGWTNDEIAAHMGISRGTVKIACRTPTPSLA
ncbi:MAG: helix-turn-helix domain-containing protein [Collinsella sp.]